MIKFFSYFVLSMLLLGGLLRFSLEFESAQDIALEQMYRAGMSNTAIGLANPDSLRVFVVWQRVTIG